MRSSVAAKQGPGPSSKMPFRRNDTRSRSGSRLYCFILIVSLCSTAVFVLFVYFEDSFQLSAKTQFIRRISPYLPLELTHTFTFNESHPATLVEEFVSGSPSSLHHEVHKVVENEPTETSVTLVDHHNLQSTAKSVPAVIATTAVNESTPSEYYSPNEVTEGINVSNLAEKSTDVEKADDDNDDYDSVEDLKFDDGEFYSPEYDSSNVDYLATTHTARPTLVPTSRTVKQKVQPKKTEQPDNTNSNQRKPRDFSLNSKGKPKKKAKKYAGMEVWNFQADWGYHHELPFIEIMPTNKIMLKKDRRVIFPNLTLPVLGGRGDQVLHALQQYENYAIRDTIDAGEQQDYLPIASTFSAGLVIDASQFNETNNPALIEAENQLMNHIFYRNKSLGDGYSVPLSSAMAAVSRSDACGNRPVFLGMATAKDELYRQLIDNFFYSLTRFHLSGCGLLVCVSDPSCVSLCQQRKFACFNYTESKDTKSVMEQIAIVKLQHVPQALKLNTSVFMLDLDVGWLHSPTIMLRAFSATPLLDVLVQEDMIFIMNRSKAAWKQWHTEPLPNIGLFLLRGNHRTARAMEIAWEKYSIMDDDYEKRQPGKDQNHVLDAVRIMRGIGGLKYAYLDNNTAPLLDKLVLKHGNVRELGGEHMSNFLQQHLSLAVHATCYEQSTKVHGLRVSGAFWSPRHYDPQRRTITAPLLWTNDGAALLAEVRSLVALAILLDRALIIPNLIADPLDDSLNGIALYRGHRMWPAFRVLKLLDPSLAQSVTLLEAGFYWRVQRDYANVPEPLVIAIPGSITFSRLLKMLQDLEVDGSKRLVISVLGPGLVDADGGKVIQRRLATWAQDSIGLGLGAGMQVQGKSIGENETAEYQHEIFQLLRRIHRPLPILPPSSALKWTAGLDGASRSIISQVVHGTRLCKRVFDPPRGNRTCFQVCD